MSITQIIKEAEVEFKETFCDRSMVVKEGITQIKYKPTVDAITSHIHTTHLAILEEVKAMCEEKKREQKHDNDCLHAGSDHCDCGYYENTLGYNSALTTLQATIQKEIDLIKK